MIRRGDQQIMGQEEENCEITRNNAPRMCTLNFSFVGRHAESLLYLNERHWGVKRPFSLQIITVYSPSCMFENACCAFSLQKIG